MGAGIAHLTFLSPKNYVTNDFCTFSDKDICKMPNLLQRVLSANRANSKFIAFAKMKTALGKRQATLQSSSWRN